MHNYFACVCVVDVCICVRYRTREWERTLYVCHSHTVIHMFFFQRSPIFPHLSLLLPVLLLLSVGLAGLHKYMTDDLCCIPNKRDFPQIFPQLWTTTLEFESVTGLMKLWRSHVSAHSLINVSTQIISNQSRRLGWLFNKNVVEAQRAINTSPII